MEKFRLMFFSSEMKVYREHETKAAQTTLPGKVLKTLIAKAHKRQGGVKTPEEGLSCSYEGDTEVSHPCWLKHVWQFPVPDVLPRSGCDHRIIE